MLCRDKLSAFVKRVQNGLHKTSQKLRQLERIKFHVSPSPSFSCLLGYFMHQAHRCEHEQKRLHENPAHVTIFMRRISALCIPLSHFKSQNCALLRISTIADERSIFPNTALPATRTSAPALVTSGAVSAVIPPSTSI